MGEGGVAGMSTEAKAMVLMGGFMLALGLALGPWGVALGSAVIALLLIEAGRV